MARQEARDHHFVPRTLLRPWLVEEADGDLDLHGYWWDEKQAKLVCKRRGLKSFCFQIDLLSLKAHNLGRDAIERLFFGEIDTKGAAARDVLLTDGAPRLSEDQRCDFARLLLSLDARRPAIVKRLRAEGTSYLANELDSDPRIRTAMAVFDNEKPSSYVERELGWSLEDQALTVIQGLVDNPKVGKRLINAHWGVKRLGSFDGSFVLSDRPLIRTLGYDKPGAIWALPLTPKAAFIAANHHDNYERLMRTSAPRFAKSMNRDSTAQTERFVFSTEMDHEKWLSKYLRRST